MLATFGHSSELVVCDVQLACRDGTGCVVDTPGSADDTAE